MKNKKVVSSPERTPRDKQLDRRALRGVFGGFALGPPPIHQTPTPGVADDEEAP